jgi:hypothetical protein
LQTKPYAIHVGYLRDLTSYEPGKSGKVPSYQVMEWLNENVSGWEFIWTAPKETKPVLGLMDYISEISLNQKDSGGTFYFDSEEDRLLFCLRWLDKKQEQQIFWHPV